MKRRLLMLLASAAVLGSLTGCFHLGSTAPLLLPKISLVEARAVQNEALVELVSYVPAELITGGREEPIATMSAMWCGSPDSSLVFLPGGYDVYVPIGTDLDSVLEQVLIDYGAKPGWSATSAGEGGERVIELFSPQGYNYFVEYYPVSERNLVYSVSSFSPCISEPDDFDIFERY